MLKRHILKTISYRVIGTLTTISIAYFCSDNINIASLIGIGEICLKPFIYFLHERFWYKFIKTKKMISFKPYYYYSKEDSKKEPIDKILAPNEFEAFIYFCERKNIDEITFNKLYNIIEDTNGSKH